MTGRPIYIVVLTLGFSVAGLHAQVATVRARVEVEGASKAGRAPMPTTVVWITPMSASANLPRSSASEVPVRLTQKNKSFEPHVLVVPAGSAVEFPNRDPFFHNVFSLFEGKRFDLGLYEAGTTRMVHFDRPGISYIFCNIHPEMSAVVITLATPFYAVVHGEGPIEIPNVPYGRYQLHTWSEGTGPENPQPPGTDFTVAEESPKAVIIRVPAINRQNLAHKNKYGRDYDAPTPDSPVYRPQP
jgi:plastocyanin